MLLDVNFERENERNNFYYFSLDFFGSWLFVVVTFRVTTDSLTKLKSLKITEERDLIY